MKNHIKELMKEEKYQEAINFMKKEYVKLFWEMLEYKKIDNFITEGQKEDDFELLLSEIAIHYPQYSDRMIRLSNSLWDVEDTYLDVLNGMIHIYDSIKKGYQKEDPYYSEDMWDF